MMSKIRKTWNIRFSYYDFVTKKRTVLGVNVRGYDIDTSKAFNREVMVDGVSISLFGRIVSISRVDLEDIEELTFRKEEI